MLPPWASVKKEKYEGGKATLNQQYPDIIVLPQKQLFFDLCQLMLESPYLSKQLLSLAY